MPTAEQYLRPDVIRQVARLDLRAKFIVEGFLSGLHASPFHGFSVEFSEHRKYVPGDDLKDLDWNVYAKTDKYYLKKFQAETNVTGYLAVDLSASMNWSGYQAMQRAGMLPQLLEALKRSGATAEQLARLAAEPMTKFDYAVCLAAALGYLMIHQQDPVGLVAFDDSLRGCLPPRSRRSHLAAILATLANLQPTGSTDVAGCLLQLASMVRTRSLILVFSDLLTDAEPVLRSLHALRHRGHEIIVFHVLDEAEVLFPFEGLVEFFDVESPERLVLDAPGIRGDYLQALAEFRRRYQEECSRARIDYVPIDTSVTFDKALLEYLIQRQRRF
jgi:uncharacterized protein (DUF58 family)